MCKTVFEGKAATAATVVTPVSPPSEATPASTDVDIAPCPKCKSELTVSESDLGNDVECPHCQTVYKAERPQARSGTLLAKSVRRPEAPPASASGEGEDSKKKPYEFKPKKGKKKDSPFLEEDDEDEDERSSKRKKSSRRDDDDDDDDEDDRPRRRKKRRRRDDDDDDDLDDSRHRTYAPHDGVLNLILALVAFFFNGSGFLCCVCMYALPPLLAIYVIIKSSMSLSEIKKGLMDPGGRTLLMIALIIAILALLAAIGGLVVHFGFRAALMGGSGGGFGGGRNDDF